MPRNRNRKKQQSKPRQQQPYGPQTKKAAARSKRRRNKRKMIKGQGSYTIGALAAHLARQIPEGTFEAVGGALGSAAGRGLATFTGVGDYVFNDLVHTPSLPTRNSNQGWGISNCEYVTDVYSGGTPFTLTSMALNPADNSTFPWLSRIANLYQKYRFKQLIFEFRSNTSDYAASGPMGNVIFSPVYNVLADQPVTKQQLEAFAHAVSTKPSNSIMCGVECDPRDSNIKWYYTRNPSSAATQFTDMGAFYIATNGLAAAAGLALGELWIHYTIEFDEPILTGVQAMQSYCRATCFNNAAGLCDVTFAGFRAIGNSATWIDAPDTNISATTAAFRNFAYGSGQPTVPYFISIDNNSGLTNGTRFWFSSAGTYLVSFAMSLLTGYTTVTAGSPLYDANITSGTGSASNMEYNRPLGTTSQSGGTWSSVWTIVVKSPNSSVDFTRRPGQIVTGATLPVINESVVRITRL